ncbi:MAG: hypothetical protein U1E67_04630 [Hyphomicrobiales bacterium]
MKNIKRRLRIFEVSHGGSEGDAPVLEGEPGEADPTELTFWETVRASQDIAEYQAYLKQYPDGQFRILAEARINKLKSTPLSDQQNTEIEVAFWDSIKNSDDMTMFEAYLAKYPDGHFADLAHAHLNKDSS